MLHVMKNFYGRLMLDIEGETLSNEEKKWHRRISFIKSGIRIAGYALIPFNLIAATVVLVISEVVGIVEELV